MKYECDKVVMEYLQQNIETTTELLRLIIDTDLISIIDRNFLKELNLKQYVRQVLWDKRQILMNKLFEVEIIQIAHAFEEEGIRVVFLKGLLLAKKLYKQPEVRKSDDIDILVKIDTTKDAIRVLASLGYRFANEMEQKTLFDKSNAELQRMFIHIPPFVKETDKLNATVQYIHLDCHIAVYGRMIDKFEFADEIMERSRPIDLNGGMVYELDKHDNLVFLIAHYVKDVFRNQVLWNILGGSCRFRPRFNLIHDMAKLIQLEKVDFSIIYNRIKRIDKLAEFKIVFLIILVSKKFSLLKKPMNPSRFRTHPAVPELSALCVIPAVFLKT